MTQSDGAGFAAPPQLSPDGAWWWDGQQWVPRQVPPVATNDGLAIASLISSLVWAMGLGSIAAIVLGHMSRGKAATEGRPKSGVALAGLILGYLGAAVLALMLIAAIAIPTFLNHRQQQDRERFAPALRDAALAQESYWTNHETYATSIDQLEGLTPPPGVFLHVESADAGRYCLSASAQNSSTATVWFYDSSAVDSDSQLTTRNCV